MIIDLCHNAHLNPEAFDALKKISLSKEGDFNDLIGRISESLFDKLDWWVELPASRNTLQSPLFYRYCCIYLIIDLSHSGKNIEKVIVDSTSLLKIIKELKEKENLSFEIDGPDGELPSFQFYIRKSFKLFFDKWKTKWAQFRAAKKTKNHATEFPRNGLILIDQFVLPNFITKERYYNSLYATLSLEQKKKTFFVPTFVLIKDEDFEETYYKLRNCDRNFLIKEDYLASSDLLFSLLHLFRVWFVKPSIQMVAGIDISSLIREELLSRAGFDGAIEGLLNYRFAQRLKEKSFNLSLVIDWWEGQSLDKGWNLGFHTFFPEVPIKGYLGYAPRMMELQLRPSESEVKYGVAPETISVIGTQFSSDMESKDPPFQTETAPAFRFDHLWDNSNTNEQHSGSFTILLGLSVIEAESVIICEKIIDSGLVGENEFEFIIKPHPSMNMSTMKNRLGEKWNDNFQEVKGSTPNYMRKSDLLITGMSSIGLEAVVMGVPVIIVETMTGLTYDPIPESVPKELWRTCRSSEGIKEAINHFSNRSSEEVWRHQKLSAQIKKDYFEPVTRESVYRFLELSV